MKTEYKPVTLAKTADQPPRRVVQDWVWELPMQQQTVLLLACRGPDGIGKMHPTKEVVRRYRASVLNQAYTGRATKPDEATGGGNFMTLAWFRDRRHWQNEVIEPFFDHVDGIPHHAYMHLAHGAGLLAYNHPEPRFRLRWMEFYQRCGDDLHFSCETKQQMNARLSDWFQRYWEPADASDSK